MAAVDSQIDIAELRQRIDQASPPVGREERLRRRREHLEKIRGAMTYIGGVESPIDVEWDAMK